MFSWQLAGINSILAFLLKISHFIQCVVIYLSADMKLLAIPEWNLFLHYILFFSRRSYIRWANKNVLLHATVSVWDARICKFNVHSTHISKLVTDWYISWQIRRCYITVQHKHQLSFISSFTGSIRFMPWDYSCLSIVWIRFYLYIFCFHFNFNKICIHLFWFCIHLFYFTFSLSYFSTR